MDAVMIWKDVIAVGITANTDAMTAPACVMEIPARAIHAPHLGVVEANASAMETDVLMDAETTSAYPILAPVAGLTRGAKVAEKTAAASISVKLRKAAHAHTGAVTADAIQILARPLIVSSDAIALLEQLGACVQFRTALMDVTPIIIHAEPIHAQTVQIM